MIWASIDIFHYLIFCWIFLGRAKLVRCDIYVFFEITEVYIVCWCIIHCNWMWTKKLVQTGDVVFWVFSWSSALRKVWVIWEVGCVQETTVILSFPSDREEWRVFSRREDTIGYKAAVPWAAELTKQNCKKMGSAHNCVAPALSVDALDSHSIRERKNYLDTENWINFKSNKPTQSGNRRIWGKGDEKGKSHLSALLSMSYHFLQNWTFISFPFNSFASESSWRLYEN